MDHWSPAGEDKDVQTRADEAYADLAQFTVIVAIVRDDQGSPEIEMLGGGEIYAMLFLALASRLRSSQEKPSTGRNFGASAIQLM